jgi:hypothetical protein
MEDEEPLGDIEPGNALMHNRVRSFDIDADNGGGGAEPIASV